MKLSAKGLINVDGLNAFKVSNQVTVNEGQSNSLYFQLVDLDRDGIRYIPTTGSTLSAKFNNLDDSLIFTSIASNPYPDDRSIFKITLISSQIPAAGGILFTLNEGGIDKPFLVAGIVAINSLSNVGGC